MAKAISSSLEFYYDEDLFNKTYTSELDPTSLVLLESGAMVEDAQKVLKKGAEDKFNEDAEYSFVNYGR